MTRSLKLPSRRSRRTPTQRSALFPGPLHPVDKVYKALGVNRSEGEIYQTFTDKLAQVPLRYEPGTAWMYSLGVSLAPTGRRRGTKR